MEDQSSLQGDVSSRAFSPTSSFCRDMDISFHEHKDDIFAYIRQKVLDLEGIKFWISSCVQFSRLSSSASSSSSLSSKTSSLAATTSRCATKTSLTTTTRRGRATPTAIRQSSSVNETRSDSDNVDDDGDDYILIDSIEDATFNSKTVRAFPGHLDDDSLTEDVSLLFKDILAQFEEFTSHGSGWRLNRVTKIIVHSVRHNPLRRLKGNDDNEDDDSDNDHDSDNDNDNDINNDNDSDNDSDNDDDDDVTMAATTSVSSTASSTPCEHRRSNVPLDFDSSDSRFQVEKTYLATPNAVRGVLNVKNNDNKCILWSILAKLYPAKRNAGRVSHYKHHEVDIDMTGIRYPTPVTDIAKIEQQNDLTIHVFVCKQDGGIQPVRVSKREHPEENPQRHINLLLLFDNDRFHYALISRFRGLMNEPYYHAEFCYNCLKRFSSRPVLDNHRKSCIATQQILFPEENEFVTFKSRQKQMRAPFVIYADFECFNQVVTTTTTTATKHGGSSSSAAAPVAASVQDDSCTTHVPSGFCYLVVSSSSSITRKKFPVTYTGPNVVETFFDHMIQEERKIGKILKRKVPITFTDANAAAFLLTDACYVCDEPFDSKNIGDKVRDHDHLTGEYRGAAHINCNLAMRYSKTDPLNMFGFRIPIVFHNLRGYDGHLLMEAFGKYRGRRLSCIANSSEKFITFSTGSLQFIDSLQFLSASLDKLVHNLASKSHDSFHNLLRAFPRAAAAADDDEDTTAKKTLMRNMLLRKGVFPYDYFDGETKLHCTSLPTREQFVNRLKQQECSVDDYEHARKMWAEFKCKTFKEYHDLYMKIDVLQLSDVFENFRDVAMATYKLDPANYITLASYAWDSMLR